MSPNSKRKLVHYWRRHIRPLLILILVFTAFRSIIADWNDVPTGSMRSTIIEGDRIYVNKLAYGLKFPFTTWHLARWNAPARGEIVVFYSPEDTTRWRDGTRLVKRLIGIPGDRIQIHNDRIILNGQPLKYDDVRGEDVPGLSSADRATYHFFIEHLDDHAHLIQIAKFNTTNPWQDVPEFTVPAGKYFVMGDNRDNSKDARFFNQPVPYRSQPYDPDVACVPLSEFVGRSSRTVFSLDHDDYWLPRKDRWFKGLP